MFSGFCDINVNITLNIFSLETHVDPDSMPMEYTHPVLLYYFSGCASTPKLIQAAFSLLLELHKT